MGKHQRNGVEWQGRPTTTSQSIGAHAESKDKAAPHLCSVRVRRFIGQKLPPPTARSTPFLCSCEKKRGGAPKKRAFGCRHGSCSVPPASPTNSKPQHHHRLRQADLSARSTTNPLPKSGEDDPRQPRQQRSRGWWSHRGKRRFSLAARHRFFGQAPKKWGRKAGQANENLPTYRRTSTSVKKRGNPRRGFPLKPPPALQ